MMILGFNGGNCLIEEAQTTLARHDAAAVLIRDGEVIAAVEEERLDRLKHSTCFPRQAIRFCLEQANAGFGDIEAIATNSARSTVRRWARDEIFTKSSPPLSGSEESFVSQTFQAVFGADVLHQLRFCPHHVAHAVSAFVPSGFERALIVSLDGDGDGRSGNVMTGDRSGVKLVRDFGMQQSIGHFYAQCIALLGYGIFDEYKAMGLAPYGDPLRYKSLFQQQYSLLPDGDFYLKPGFLWMQAFDDEGLMMHVRRKGEEFTQVHKDFAAALQAAVERIVFHVLRHAQRITGERNLCLAGGVAHNCTLTGKLLKSGLFERIFVQPAAHDAGGSLGAAWQAHCEIKGEFPLHRQEDVYWGPSIPPDKQLEAELGMWSSCITVDRPRNVEMTAAVLLADGAALGWVQGRSEFGPRALGNRSILADPRPAENKQRINAMVKKREGYRPFAPSVQEERAQQWFDIPGESGSLPFMNVIVTVRSELRDILGAITHVDGTARIQTVSRKQNPMYWRLIECFRQLTAVPVLLNTSLNNHAEPIVDSVQDAITCFLTTGLESMVIGPYLLKKKESAELLQALAELYISVSPGYLLVGTVIPGSGDSPAHTSYSLQSVKAERLRKRSQPLSSELYQLLANADGRSTVNHLLARQGGAGTRTDLEQELFALWEERAVRLRPDPPEGLQ